MFEGIEKPFVLSVPKRAANVPLLVTSPHSGSDYPADFLAASLLDAHDIRQSEDMYVDALYADAPPLGLTPSCGSALARVSSNESDCSRPSSRVQ